MIVGSPAVAARDDRDADGKWKPGQSGNPGGMPRGIRALEQAVLVAHGPNVLVALQALFDLGMDEDQPGKVRVPALNAFVNHVKGAPRAPKDEDATPETDGALLERVAETLVRKNPELVQAKLTSMAGGKK